jgi:hypothetical protein
MSSTAISIDPKPTPVILSIMGDETTWDAEDGNRPRDSVEGPQSLEVERGIQSSASVEAALWLLNVVIVLTLHLSRTA